MTLELWTLLGATLLLWIAIIAQQLTLDKAVGAQYALSNREQGFDFAGATPLYGRLTRTVRNHVEGICLFAPLILIAAAADISNIWTRSAAIAFFITRILHFLFYAAGITPCAALPGALGSSWL